jgi:hypothetical protein
MRKNQLYLGIQLDAVFIVIPPVMPAIKIRKNNITPYDEIKIIFIFVGKIDCTFKMFWINTTRKIGPKVIK